MKLYIHFPHRLYECHINLKDTSKALVELLDVQINYHVKKHVQYKFVNLHFGVENVFKVQFSHF